MRSIKEIILEYSEGCNHLTEVNHSFPQMWDEDGGYENKELIGYNLKPLEYYNKRKYSYTKFNQQNPDDDFAPTDLLYLNTINNDNIKEDELERFGKKTNKVLIINGITNHGSSNELGEGRGIYDIILDFGKKNGWIVSERINDIEKGIIVLTKTTRPAPKKTTKKVSTKDGDDKM